MKPTKHKTLQAGFRLCTSGSREIIINGELYVVTPNVLCIHSPILSVVELSRTADYDELCIMEDLEAFHGVRQMGLDTAFRLKLWEKPCLLLPPSHIALFVNREKEIDEKRNQVAEAGSQDERNLLLRMLHLLEQETFLELILLYYRNCAVQPQPIKKGESVAYQFIYSVTQKFKEIRKVSLYAEMFGLSASRLTHIVKEKTGRSPSDWIIIITVINAQDLLRDTEMSIKEIAASLNFPEQFTFRKFFKQHTGYSPTAYRQNVAATCEAQ